MKYAQNCDCGEIQTIKYVVEDYPRTKYKRDINGLQKGDEAIDWLCNFDLHLNI